MGKLEGYQQVTFYMRPVLHERLKRAARLSRKASYLIIEELLEQHLKALETLKKKERT